MIKLEKLCVQLGRFKLNNISLLVEEREYFIILGPTGAGKTVLLESIAGLNPVNNGRVWLKDQDITHQRPEKRGISIVYQDNALFPHLSVRDNILFGLKLRKKTSREMEAVQEWLVNLLGISHLLSRKPYSLSGGERQKVALARALSSKPDLLLLDEPLSALDPETRETVQDELRKLHEVLDNTIIHVTHDFEEAMALGDRIAVIGEGQLKQVGTPEQIFRQPNSEFVARFVLMRNVFSGEVIRDVSGKTVFKTPGADLSVTTDLKGPCQAGIRAEDVLVSLQPLAPDTPNVFSGTVNKIVDKGSVMNITVSLPPDIIVLITRNQFKEMQIKTGEKIFLKLDTSSIHLFKE